MGYSASFRPSGTQLAQQNTPTQVEVNLEATNPTRPPSRPTEWTPSVRISWAALAVVTVSVALSVTLSQAIAPTLTVYRSAMIVHLLCIVLGFGAVLFVDWTGLLWLTGRRTFGQARLIATVAETPIWVGYGGLLASGALLHVDLSVALSWLKIAAVLLIGLNGVMAHTTAKRLSALPATLVPQAETARLCLRLGGITAISQLGWWTGIVVGLLTDIRRR